jgi:hypothetical protein
MKSIKERLKAQQYITKEVNGVTFTLKKMDYLEFQRLASRLKRNSTDFEIELILSCIKNTTGLKIKHVAEKLEDFTPTELETDLEYDIEYVQMYLGKNQEVLVTLYESIAKDFLEFTEQANKKKENSNTELNKSSS